MQSQVEQLRDRRNAEIASLRTEAAERIAEAVEQRDAAQLQAGQALANLREAQALGLQREVQARRGALGTSSAVAPQEFGVATPPEKKEEPAVAVTTPLTVFEVDQGVHKVEAFASRVGSGSTAMTFPATVKPADLPPHPQGQPESLGPFPGDRFLAANLFSPFAVGAGTMGSSSGSVPQQSAMGSFLPGAPPPGIPPWPPAVPEKDPTGNPMTLGTIPKARSAEDPAMDGGPVTRVGPAAEPAAATARSNVLPLPPTPPRHLPPR